MLQKSRHSGGVLWQADSQGKEEDCREDKSECRPSRVALISARRGQTYLKAMPGKTRELRIDPDKQDECPDCDEVAAALILIPLVHLHHDIDRESADSERNQCQQTAEQEFERPINRRDWGGGWGKHKALFVLDTRAQHDGTKKFRGTSDGSRLQASRAAFIRRGIGAASRGRMRGVLPWAMTRA